MIISKTPFRISLSGGSCDYKSYYSKYGPVILTSFAIDKYCYISVKESSPLQSYKTALRYSKTEFVSDNNLIEHPGVRGVLQYLEIEDGLEINTSADLQSQTGVGTSSAFIVGLLNALCHLKGRKISPHELGQITNYIERDLLGEPGGTQDVWPPAYGGFNSIEIDTDGVTRIRPLPICQDFITELEDNLVLFSTGSTRSSFQLAEENEKPSNDKHKHAILDISRLMYTALCREDLIECGKLLHDSWTLKKKLAINISNPAIDALYDRILNSGGIGGKLLGSGGQGFICTISSPGQKQRLLNNMKDIKFIEPKIDFKGSRIIGSDL